MRFDAGIVDSFLHGMDRPYTVQNCLNFVEQGELVFRGWINRYDYYSESQIPESNPLFLTNTILAGRKYLEGNGVAP